MALATRRETQDKELPLNRGDRRLRRLGRRTCGFRVRCFLRHGGCGYVLPGLEKSSELFFSQRSGRRTPCVASRAALAAAFCAAVIFLPWAMIVT